MLQHDPIQKLNANLWRVEGAVPGMSLRRVMTIAKRSTGGLVIHNGIALTDAEFAEVQAWGTPEYLLVPSAYHRLDAPQFHERYPTAKVLTPRGSKKAVEARVPVDGTYDDFPSDPLVAPTGGDDSAAMDGAVQLLTLPGTNEREGVMLVRSGDGITVVFNDVVMNMDTRPDVVGFLFTTILGSAPGPRISRLTKWALVNDRKALRSEIERLAALPSLFRLIVSHDKVVEGKDAASGALLRAAGYL